MSMRHATGRVWLTTFLLIVCGLGVSGCRLGNVSFNIQIPLGLDGTIGLLNPDGGSIGGGSDTGDGDDNGGTVIPPDIL